ncbi:MAG: pyruvate formate lyase-activating protein, partial [Candidatus Heimdallarchaeota archaeon]|nr:pyruvate formate lyase-activating protein [Candidatus Heimdallarchaeota archaeon]
MWRTRPDYISVWENPKVVNRLKRYYQLIHEEKVARYLLAKAMPINIDLNSDLQTLWREHDRLAEEFKTNIKEYDKRPDSSIVPEPVNPSFLTIKVKIADEILKNCCFCERKCQKNREEGELGVCKVGKEAVISSAFLHRGEETVLVPSGTIFFSGCTFKCVFCQNYTISQKWRTSDGKILDGVDRNPRQIAAVAGA